jgi:hypothetical protein
VEGALLEWVDEADEHHTRYFGHWSDDLKQDTVGTTRNMCDELCVDGDALHLAKGLAVGGTVWKGTNGTATSYHYGKSIYGQGILSAKLGIAINAQIEAPGHSKWWLDGKTGSDKCFYQQAMCSIVTPETKNNGKQMLSAKWIEHDGYTVAVSPADKCVHLLSNPAQVNGIKNEGMQAKRKGKALVERNDYETYTMEDVPPIPNFKLKLAKGQFNGICAHYNIRTDPDLGMGWAALCWIPCGCDSCKDQLGRPWVPGVDVFVQQRYAGNKECMFWPSYKGADDWKICQLIPKMEEDEKWVQHSIQ